MFKSQSPRSFFAQEAPCMEWKMILAVRSYGRVWKIAKDSFSFLTIYKIAPGYVFIALKNNPTLHPLFQSTVAVHPIPKL